MPQQRKLELYITLADGGSNTRDIIELYGAQARADIDQTAWNLCDCDSQLQIEKFDNLVLDNWSITNKRGEDFRVKAQFTVNANSSEFVTQVINEYMDGFVDFIGDTINGYYSRTGTRTKINLHQLDWELKIA